MTNTTSAGRIDFRQQGRWIRGPVIATAGGLEEVLAASVGLAHAVDADCMRIVATPSGERPFVVHRWAAGKGWEVAGP